MSPDRVDPGELAAWLRLAWTRGIGNITARRLLAAFGLPQAIFEQPLEALRQVVSAADAASLQKPPEGFEARVAVTRQWLEAASFPGERQIVTLGSPGYPQALLDTEDPPLMLYLLGQVPPRWPHAISIVGSRNPTPQGLANARDFSRSFAQAGLTVVSGLALGIDGAAHEGALDGAVGGGPATIAVVGTGLDTVYPKRHASLAQRIVQRGLIVSEYPLGTPPLSENFPRRNRIISALGQGTLVVEAALMSGSLITAKQAAEQGRDVFAIPGSIHSPLSRGCHSLIKQGAKLVECAQDVLEELPSTRGSLLARNASSSTSTIAGTSELDGTPTQDGVLESLGHDPVGLDALVARTGLAPAQLQARLLELELAGEIARLPGGLYQRTAIA
ncbi:DNA-processing protein DprA [Caenimonas aquaedulcis]|uniref:DNA-protecting protein DprA n=1 Tax=Caenimonas aquaedulcis TaxID=2793270 RepID=A0A931H5A3_9BURK|nr:DNA-processing protein DprA [Caenimonas aquaedulcis]MBG9388841.1 DNA-protecting protein DprA [Caenimonas aquaedulcis]